MALNVDNMRALIEDTLRPLSLWDANAEELLLATCAIESDFGTFRTQLNGPALGIFQMEPEDHDDIWSNYLKYRSVLANQIKQLDGSCIAESLINNDKYAIALCRVHYLRAPTQLPDCNSLGAIWDYYKRYYNSIDGAAVESAFLAKYRMYVQGPAQ